MGAKLDEVAAEAMRNLTEKEPFIFILFAFIAFAYSLISVLVLLVKFCRRKKPRTLVEPI